MAKPICIIKVDERTVIAGNGTSGQLHIIQKAIEERFDDYHVLTLPFTQDEDERHEPIQIQVFYEKDFTEIQYQELKEYTESHYPKASQISENQSTN